ncbi:MAG: BMP family ABC transporter substrate-binding protein [Deltaproteobacteria bacterium]|nr:BMP family ABC transporter substrate-binding protein [Deltaproteobacteria bacterium]
MARSLRVFVLFINLLSSLCLAELKVGLALDKGGRDDKSFNAAAYKGALEAKEKLGITLKTVESSDDISLEPTLRTFAQKGYPLIVAVGFVQRDAVEKVAEEFPKTHFVLIDSTTQASNVRSVVFKEHEGSFLVGALAALSSKSQQVGFIGGMDIPMIRRFQLGFESGVKYVNPKAKVLNNYVGSTSDAWRNPTKAKELALSQYNKGADVIFVPAGASGLGVFDAAEQTQKLVVGCDSNQNWVKPGKVLTSMLKRVDIAVYQAIELETKGAFKGGVFDLGLAENGVDYSLDEFNRNLVTPTMETKLKAIRTEIIKKQITVPDYYLNMKKTASPS